MFRKLLTTSDDWTLTLLRLVLGVVFFAHGAQKMLGWFGGYGFSGTMGYFTHGGIPAPLAFLAIAAEFFGGIGLVVVEARSGAHRGNRRRTATFTLSPTERRTTSSCETPMASMGVACAGSYVALAAPCTWPASPPGRDATSPGGCSRTNRGRCC